MIPDLYNFKLEYIYKYLFTAVRYHSELGWVGIFKGMVWIPWGWFTGIWSKDSSLVKVKELRGNIRCPYRIKGKTVIILFHVF